MVLRGTRKIRNCTLIVAVSTCQKMGTQWTNESGDRFGRLVWKMEAFRRRSVSIHRSLEQFNLGAGRHHLLALCAAVWLQWH